MKKLRIAMDFDHTFTEDVNMWSLFIVDAKNRGHEIKFVTFRYPEENQYIEKFAKDLEIEIIYTSRQKKRWFYDADIWIDDTPELIVKD